MSREFLIFRTICRVLFWGALAGGIFYAVGHINWVGDHYCWGSITKCYLGGK